MFYARSVDLYLRDGGLIGMVMPHSALQSGQHAKWRTGKWESSDGNRALLADFQIRKPWDLEKLVPNDFFPVPSSVVFAKRLGEDGKAKPLNKTVLQWLGATGSDSVKQIEAEITDISGEHVSDYVHHTRNGATLVPRVLIFVNETVNPTTVRLGGTMTSDPRRGGYDKEPWKSLDLSELIGNTIEDEHVFDVHLGETLVPYATLPPLTAILPFKRGAETIEYDEETEYGVSYSAMERRMRNKWPVINRAWDDNKREGDRRSLVQQLDFYGKLSSQIAWQADKGDRPIRVVYNQSGAPTASLVTDDTAMVDYTLYWLTCTTVEEACYLTAIINSSRLYERLRPLMPKGQFGARHVQTHLWRLPIPEFDAGESLHVSIADAGRQAADGVERELENLRQRYPKLTVTIARRGD